MGRRILWASLALAPATIAVDLALHPSKTLLFVLSSASLIPLAWLIGETTEHAAEHTGPGVGGFLNASFGNAPELIIALFAVGDGLPQVVRGSLAGSVISNLLLVFGVAQIVGPEKEIDRRSLVTQLGLVGVAVVLFVVPSVGRLHRRDRSGIRRCSCRSRSRSRCSSSTSRSRAATSTATAASRAARRPSEAWPLPLALGVLAVATGATAIVSELLVHSIHGFASAVGASEFFIAAVIVAIVGNAAEHGGAIVIARAGKMKLASEIAISSSAQVGAARRTGGDAALALLHAPAAALVPLGGARRDGGRRRACRRNDLGRADEALGRHSPRRYVRSRRCGFLGSRQPLV